MFVLLRQAMARSGHLAKVIAHGWRTACRSCAAVRAHGPTHRKLLLAALLAVLSAVGFSARAADAETRAFDGARKPFEDTIYDLAEKEFANFVARFPASPRVSQALLFQARAALAQKKYQTAIDLLTTNIANAAGIADQFQLWIARTLMESGKLASAADAFALLVSKHTNSPLRLEGTLGEAQARFDLKQWPRVVQLLQNPGGVFQQHVARSPDSRDAVQGRLLLAEALLKQRDYAAAEQATASIAETNLNGRAKWHRDYLRAQAQFSAQKLEDALATASNLVALASTVRDPALESVALALEGEILEALNRPAAALAVYELNQRAGTPPERMREALFKIVELTVAQGRLTHALARLQTFLAEHTNEIGSDVALLTVAELRLKQHQLQTLGTNGLSAVPATETNLLAEAIANCERLLREFTNSVFAGQAQLVRAWTLLAQGNNAESLIAFRSAADTLAWSESQAVARFKVADLEFQSGELTNALRDYRRVLGQYNSLRRVQVELVPRARYQMLQVSLATRDLAAADEAVEPILREFPMNALTERTLLLYGQTVDELGDAAAARNVFSKFIERSPNSFWRPQAELAIARTFEHEHNWAGAIAQYDAWVEAHPTNENLAVTEFYRAQANSNAGHATNALMLFTNLIARFPTHELAQRAQHWIGDFYYGHGEFQEAEANYQRVYLNSNWPTRALKFEAMLKAGRSALMRQSFDDARYYFTNLIETNATACPDSVRVQACLEYGNAVLRGSSNPERLRQALSIYDYIPKNFQNDPLRWRAWGAMADCYFQLGSNDPATYYPQALAYYAKATNELSGDISARLQAMVGIGNVQKEQARLARESGGTVEARNLLDSAMLNYTSVLYRSYDDEPPDLFWLKQAAINAAELAESQEKWDQALNIYRRLLDMVPALQKNEFLNRRVKRAEEKKAALKRD